MRIRGTALSGVAPAERVHFLDLVEIPNGGEQCLVPLVTKSVTSPGGLRSLDLLLGDFLRRRLQDFDEPARGGREVGVFPVVRAEAAPVG